METIVNVLFVRPLVACAAFVVAYLLAALLSASFHPGAWHWLSVAVFVLGGPSAAIGAVVYASRQTK
jgi:hypothetical protein